MTPSSTRGRASKSPGTSKRARLAPPASSMRSSSRRGSPGDLRTRPRAPTRPSGDVWKRRFGTRQAAGERAAPARRCGGAGGGGEPVSAFVFPARDLSGFPEANRAIADGHGDVETMLHGHAVAFASDGERAVIVLASPAVGPLEPLAHAFLEGK